MSGVMRSPSGRKAAYGGVVVDSEGRLLLREPANHFDGYVWTFPKGRPDAGETAEAAAYREVREETGVVARIVGELPGWFEGGSSDTRFFVMEPVEDTGELDGETWRVAWALLEEAEALVRETRNPVGRRRDLAVITALRHYREDAS